MIMTIHEAIEAAAKEIYARSACFTVDMIAEIIRKHLSPHMGREDDATAIDADWLTSVLRQNPNTLNWLLRRSTPLTIEIEESGGGFWMWFCHDHETPVPIRQLKTRADVRDACRGLGVITLSETETEKGAGE